MQYFKIRLNEMAPSECVTNNVRKNVFRGNGLSRTCSRSEGDLGRGSRECVYMQGIGSPSQRLMREDFPLRAQLIHSKNPQLSAAQDHLATCHSLC